MIEKDSGMTTEDFSRPEVSNKSFTVEKKCQEDEKFGWKNEICNLQNFLDIA